MLHKWKYDNIWASDFQSNQHAKSTNHYFYFSLNWLILCIIWICDVCIHSRHEAAETIGISDDNMLISLYTYDIRNQSCDFVTTITTAEGEANMRQRKKLFPANWGCTLQGIWTGKHHWYTANNNDARKTKRATIDSFFHLNFVSMWEAYECVCMWYERKGKHINKKKTQSKLVISTKVESHIQCSVKRNRINRKHSLCHLV